LKKAKAPFDAQIFLATVGEGKTILTVQKNQIVFSQGKIADAVFYIQRGGIKLTVVSQQGKEAVVAILGLGHFFGEGCLNGHPLRIATASTTDECVITRLEKATMIATIHKEPGFSEIFMAYLLSRIGRTEEDLIDQLFNSSETISRRSGEIRAAMQKPSSSANETVELSIFHTDQDQSAGLNEFVIANHPELAGSTIEWQTKPGWYWCGLVHGTRCHEGPFPTEEEAQEDAIKTTLMVVAKEKAANESTARTWH